MKKFIGIIVTVVVFSVTFAYMFVSENSVTRISAQQNKKEVPSVIFVVERGSRSGIAKYLYKDLLYGFSRTKIKPEIGFVDIKSASSKLFSDNSVVIVVNEGSANSLQSNIQKFAEANSEQANMIVIAFVPGRKSTLSATPKGIDVVSSSSKEDPAANFMKREVAPMVLDILQSQ